MRFILWNRYNRNICIKVCKKVYGIEIVKEAAESANENAKINKVDNIEFMAGDVEKVFEKMLVEKM